MHTNAISKCARVCRLTSIRRGCRDGAGTRKASSPRRLVAARHESGGRSLAAQSARAFSGGSSRDDVYTPEQRREDHKHCVELVQTRDFEGYCELV